MIAVGQKIGRALGVAHDAGVLHRDVKPANILMTAYGEPALADFGIARVEGGQQTATGLVTASLAHAAPEVLGGGGPTAASDIYSLGSTLFELATGRAPHHRDEDQSVWALMNRVVNEPLPDPVAFGIAEPLAIAIKIATAKNAEDRYRTAGAVVTALATAPDATAEAVAAPPTVPTPAPNLTPGLPSQHDQPTAAMAPVDPAGIPAAGFPAAGIPAAVSPPAVVGGDTVVDQRGVTGGWSAPGAGAPEASRSRRLLLRIVLAASIVAAAGGAIAAVLLIDGDSPPADVAFAFATAIEGPIDAGERYDLEVDGAETGTLFRYVVDGEPIGIPTEVLAPFVAEAGRHSVAVEVTQGDNVTQTTPIELYVVGEPPAAGYRANLSSITATAENWPTALEVYDRLVDDGHTDLQLLPSDRFPTLQAGFWNLFVPGFGDDRDAGVAYCESFDLETPNECFVRFFDPEAEAS